MKRAVVVVFSLGLIVGLAVMADAAEKKKKKESSLPAAAKGFAGMVRGKVASTTDESLVLTVEKVTEVWKHSKAKDPKSLVGKKVLVKANVKEGKLVENVAKFIRRLKAGDDVTIDVNNQKGSTLTLMELTKEQREKVKEEK